MKKTIALLLVLAMVLAMAPAAFAAETSGQWFIAAGETQEWTAPATGSATVESSSGNSLYVTDANGKELGMAATVTFNVTEGEVYNIKNFGPALDIITWSIAEVSDTTTGTITIEAYGWAEWTAPKSGTVAWTSNDANAEISIDLNWNTVTSFCGTGSCTVEAGSTYVIATNSYPYDVKIAWEYTEVGEGSGSGDEEQPVDTVLEQGDNAIALKDGDYDGETYTYTAEQTGTLNIAITALSYEFYGTEQSYDENSWSYFGNQFVLTVNNTNYYEHTASVDVTAGDEVTITFMHKFYYKAWGTMNLSYGSAGDEGGDDGEDTKDDNVLDSGTADAGEDSKWTYVYTPAQNGTLTVTVGDGTSNWSSDVAYFGADWSMVSVSGASGTAEGTYAAEVEAGTKYYIRIWETDGGTLTAVPYSITFTPEESGGSGSTGEGTTVDLTTATNGAAKEEHFAVEETGIITLTISGNPGYSFWLYYPDGSSTPLASGSSETTYTYKVTQTGEYYFKFQCYDPAAWGDGDGSVTYAYSFTPCEVEVEKPAYVISDTVITEVGTHTVSMEYADVTIVTFTPETTGYYTISVDGNAVIGYYGGGSWHIANSADVEHGTSFEWICQESSEVESDTILDENYSYVDIVRTNDGQSAMIGIISDSETVSLTITKTGEYTAVEIPLLTYENKAELKQFHLCDCFTLGDYVDVYGDDHTAVLGNDGFYHLDSADGPALLIDMDYLAVLSNALNEGRGIMYAYTTDENGNAVKYDIANAVKAYEAVCDGNGYYPLTEDLIFFYEVYAVGSSVPNYVLEDGFNTQCAWMFACTTAETNHTWSEAVAVAPTCTTEGADVSTCTCCGAVKTVKTADALGHTWDEGKQTKAPTCTEEGEMTYTCTVDGCTGTKTEAIKALGHTYVDGKCACGAEDPDYVAPGTSGDAPSKTDDNTALTTAIIIMMLAAAAVVAVMDSKKKLF